MPARPRRRGRRDIAVAPATVRRLSEDAASGLLNLLGVPYLREHQFKLISALVVDRMDVWAQLACGAGKTLIFVAALLTLCMNGRGSIGIFIVPTAAITADMVATFVRLHIKVIELNGNTKAEAISLLRSPHPPPGPVVILSKPKKIVNAEILAALSPPPEASLPPRVVDGKFVMSRTSNVGIVAVDEAHCVDAWGVDFLRSFSRLGRVVNALESWPHSKRCPLLLLTATATPAERQRVQQSLRFRSSGQSIEEVASSRRDHVSFYYTVCAEVNSRSSPTDDLWPTVQERLQQGHAVLVFVETIAEAKSTQNFLKKKMIEADNIRTGVTAGLYDGSMKRGVQAHWRQEFEGTTGKACAARVAGHPSIFTIAPAAQGGAASSSSSASSSAEGGMVAVLVVTMAFSMGVNLRGLDAVILWNMPPSVTFLLQQGLRAGRDPDSKASVHVFVAWKWLRWHCKHADEALLTARKGTRSEERVRELQARAKEAKTKCHQLYLLALNDRMCRQLQHDELLGHDVRGVVPCGCCDVCRNPARAALLAPDFTPADAAIMGVLTQCDQEKTGIKFERACTLAAAKAGRGWTKKAIAARLRYHILTGVLDEIFVPGVPQVRLKNGTIKTAGRTAQYIVHHGAHWAERPVAVPVPLPAVAAGGGDGGSDGGAAAAAPAAPAAVTTTAAAHHQRAVVDA